jgi:hypothetical protein
MYVPSPSDAIRCASGPAEGPGSWLAAALIDTHTRYYGYGRVPRPATNLSGLERPPM